MSDDSDEDDDKDIFDEKTGEHKFDKMKDELYGLRWDIQKLFHSMDCKEMTDKIKNLEQKWSDMFDKLEDNTKRVNHMLLEIKGIISQTRGNINRGR